MRGNTLASEETVTQSERLTKEGYERVLITVFVRIGRAGLVIEGTPVSAEQLQSLSNRLGSSTRGWRRNVS